MKQQKMLRLVESGLMLALATILSMVKVLDLPYGGSITAFSALPILLVGYRHGTVHGLITAFAYALMQLVLGANTLSYATSPGAAVAIVVLDFLLAFTVLGLGGIFRKKSPNQGTALVLGAVVTGGMRYILHVIAGCTVWAGLSIPTEAALVYSLAYNATYMLPEVMVTAIGAWYLSRAINLQEITLTRVPQAQTESRPAIVVDLLAGAALLSTAVWDVVEIFRPLQDPESGDFVIQNLVLVNWTLVGIVTAAGAALWLIFTIVRKRLNK
ncbi:MAG: energy-coupled thiamine transporter ThiT [Clostridia bacterium]|nr:energy-coupled thiamine transporter ThiT [Clostridia bacterium]